MKWGKVVAFWIAMLVSTTLLFQSAHSTGAARLVEAAIGVLGMVGLVLIVALVWIAIREQKKLRDQSS